MQVKITKPDATLFEGEATLVQLPGTSGLFEIMNNHAPIISALAKGEVRVVNREEERKFAIRTGVVKCQRNEILILAQ